MDMPKRATLDLRQKKEASREWSAEGKKCQQKECQATLGWSPQMRGPKLQKLNNDVLPKNPHWNATCKVFCLLNLHSNSYGQNLARGPQSYIRTRLPTGNFRCPPCAESTCKCRKRWQPIQNWTSGVWVLHCLGSELECAGPSPAREWPASAERNE